MLPTRTFDFVTSTKFVNAYCNRSRSLVNLTSTSNAGVVKIDDVTNNSNGRWPDVWTTAATVAYCTADELQPIENRRM